MGSTQVVVVVRVLSVGVVLLVVVVLDCELLPPELLWLGALVCVEVVLLLEPLCAYTCKAHGTINRLIAITRTPAKRQPFCLYIISILLLLMQFQGERFV